MNGMALFAGGGGIELGLSLALGDAYRTVVYVEREAYAAASIVARMEDQALDQAPVWDDVCTFDGRPWRGVVDLISGGFPCQDISCAGLQEGILKGNRSGLWFEYGRIIGEVGPSLVFVENVSALAIRGLDIVLGTLADLGFDAEWLPLAAGDLGAPHERERIFILARSMRAGSPPQQDRREQQQDGYAGPASPSSGEMADTIRLPGWQRTRWQRVLNGSQEVANAEGVGVGARGLRERTTPTHPFPPGPGDADAWARVLQDAPALEPAVCGVADGMADRVERLRLCGNGVVPVVAAAAFHTLAGRLGIVL